jgi:hypothetical protein
VRAAVERIREHPPSANPGFEGPLKHLLGQLYLVAEEELLGDAGLRPSYPVARPSPW